MNNTIIMDFERLHRCGVEEAIYCAGKSVSQIQSTIDIAEKNNSRLLLTRLEEEKYRLLPLSYKDKIAFNPLAKIATFGKMLEQKPEKQIVVVSGGSSDKGICDEIKTTLNYHGFGCIVIEDIGVAGLWRLMNNLDLINESKIVIAVAGMEAALPTVLAGLIKQPIIAVPTSVGYGVSQGGNLALNSCLGSCSAGIVTVNIDNGFGAACAAIKFLRQL